jgi:ribose transport system substrate-binding protein
MKMTRHLKKAVLIFMAVLTIFCYGGCTEDYIVIGVSNGYVGNNWRNQMLEDLVSSFEQYKQQGLADELVIKNAGLDVDDQIEQIKSLIEMDVDLLMIDPNDEDMLNDVIEEAYRKGIPVIAFDQPVSSPYAINVVIDQQLWGQRLAEWLCQELDGQGNIVLINGLKGHPANENRVVGMKRVLDKYPKIHVIAEKYANWDQIDAQNVMTELIHEYPDIDGVLSQDGMAQGIVKAYIEAGLDMPLMTGETFIGFLRVWKELKDKQEFTTFAMNNPPGISATALGMAVRICNGYKLKPLQNNTYYYPIRDILTNDNFEEYYEVHKDKPGAYFVDEWLSEEELDRLFE